MNNYQCESEKSTRPDIGPSHYAPEKIDWLDLLEKGDAILVRDLPDFKTFQEFSNYLFSYKYIITIAYAKGRTLDHCLNFLSPDQKRKFSWMWGHLNSETGNFEKGGELLLGDITLRARPKGKASRKGFRTISVHTPGNQRNGYLLDWSYLVDDIDKVIPKLQSLSSLQIAISKSGTLAAVSRDLLMLDCPKAFWAGAEIKPVLDLIENLAHNVFRLGRFEAIRFGTIEDAYVYDIKAAYPSKIGKLQHFSPPFTDWEMWKEDYTQLDRSDIAYAFLYVEETLPEGQISIASHRTVTMGGTRICYPWGPGRRYIGLKQYQLRKKLGLKTTVLYGWMGFVRREFLPFSSLIQKTTNGRTVDSKFFKGLDVRLGGNFAATYLDILDDGTDSGLLVKKALGTYCPIYAGAIVDAVLADITSYALELPPDKIYRISIDGISSGVPLQSSSGPGNLELRYKGLIRIFTDFASDSAGLPNWASKLNGNCLEVHKDPISSFANCFGRVGDVEAQQKLFDTGFSKGIVKVPVGPSKRFPSDDLQELDYLKHNGPSEAPSTVDIPELYVNSWLEEEYMDTTDEEV